jgi:mRNA interferase YafQ
MITTINRTGAFKKDAKRAVKTCGLDAVEAMLADILAPLISGEVLDQKYQDHMLIGEWIGCRDCHLKFNLVLIYEIKNETITLHRLGSHSELFEK